MVDNDAGGIITYSQAGALGYLPWTLLPITCRLDHDAGGDVLAHEAR